MNEAGGINGLNVELAVRDTAYVPDTCADVRELKSEVVALGHSTGSPHTMAINPSLQADGILAIPLTWYSLVRPCHQRQPRAAGVPYCIEAMNMIEYLTLRDPEATTIAIATNGGDYGLDSSAGALMVAEALGLEVVYDGSGVIVATDPATLAEAATGIAGSGADLVWVTIDPTSFGGIYGQALAAGFSELSGRRRTVLEPPWSLSTPDRRATGQRLLCLGVLRALGCGVTGQPDGSRSRRRSRCAALDYYAEGVIEATILHQALLAAHEAGDMTQAGVLAAAKSLESVTFDGLAPDETYVGEPNDRLQRAQFISRLILLVWPGTSTGVTLVESEYTSPAAEAFEFTGACFAIE